MADTDFPISRRLLEGALGVVFHHGRQRGTKSKQLEGVFIGFSSR